MLFVFTTPSRLVQVALPAKPAAKPHSRYGGGRSIGIAPESGGMPVRNGRVLARGKLTRDWDATTNRSETDKFGRS